MSAGSALHGLRIGCVKYLNAQPLIRPCSGPVIFDHPSRLAVELAAGRLDVALVPSFELLRLPDYGIVDGVSISSDGPVYSVFVAYRGKLEDAARVRLDPASLTSSNLVQCILGEFRGLEPRYVADPAQGNPDDARLLIGNQAIDFRRRTAAGWKYLDLGEAWTDATGLPFVYALWLMRAGLDRPDAVADALRGLAAAGLAMRGQICAENKDYDPAFCRRYLHDHIRYGLGEREKAGLRQFEEILVRRGRLPPAPRPLRFIGPKKELQ